MKRSIPSNVPSINGLGFMPMLTLFEPKKLMVLLDQVAGKGDLKSRVYFGGAHLDGTPWLLFPYAEDIKTLLNEDICPKQPLAYNALELMLGQGLVTSKGELWKRQRRLITPIFHFGNLKNMTESLGRVSVSFLNELSQLKDLPDLPILLGKFTIRGIVDCAFGGKKYIDVEEVGRTQEDMNKTLSMFFLTEMLFGAALNEKLPLPWNKDFMKHTQRLRDLVDQAINRKLAERVEENRRAESGEGEETENRERDLLDALIDAVDPESGESIPRSLIIDECITFLFAGHDTTSSLLSWALYHLDGREDIIQRIRDEADRVYEKGKTPSHSQVPRLQYTWAVLEESLRISAPVPILDRVAAKDIEIGGIVVKKGTYVYPYIQGAHFDNRYWDDPTEFNPSRFLSETKNQKSRHAYSFCPFSAGARNCVGQKFAKLESTIFLSLLLRQYDIEIVNKDEISPHFEGTFKPLKIKCKFTSRKV